MAKQTTIPEFDFTGHGDVRVWRIRMASGAYHYATDPPIGTGNWVRTDNPEFLRRMGELGYSCLDEIPVMEDHATEVCQRCGAVGVEEHHTAPREIFGDGECETYPLVKLCPACHKNWHETVWTWAGRSRWMGPRKRAS